jgi:hypothetical protein
METLTASNIQLKTFLPSEAGEVAEGRRGYELPPTIFE